MSVMEIEVLLERALSEGSEAPRNARERSRAETRKRLMHAWCELAVENASGNVSVREVAAKAEVSIGAHLLGHGGTRAVLVDS